MPFPYTFLLRKSIAQLHENVNGIFSRLHKEKPLSQEAKAVKKSIFKAGFDGF